MKRKFLIGHLASYGDCLYATTIAKQIKHDFPDSHLTWAISSKYASILRLNPYVDHVWEITPDYGDIFAGGWFRFKKEAYKRKKLGEFDEIILSQIAPKWTHFNGTIRGTTLSAYTRPITVSKEPVVRISPDEVSRVKSFAERKGLHSFKKVILFEYAPTSGQSKHVSFEFALSLSKKITDARKDVCIILSSPSAIESGSSQIIDASELTFRENAELTKYCDLLIGCSSGITWIATSDWAKKIPTIQLLDRGYGLFYGVKYDHELCGLDTSHIIETMTLLPDAIVDCIFLSLDGSWGEAKTTYDEKYRVSYESFRYMVVLLLKYVHPFAPIPMLFRYHKLHIHLSLLGLFLSLIWAYGQFMKLAFFKAVNLLSKRFRAVLRSIT